MQIQMTNQRFPNLSAVQFLGACGQYSLSSNQLGHSPLTSLINPVVFVCRIILFYLQSV